MKKPALALLAVALLAGAASAQPQTPVTANGARSDAITLKIKRLDVLIQVVPLALTKEQYPPILAAIEKVRQKEKELRAAEDKDLAGIEIAVSKAMDEAIDKEKYPPRETQNMVASMYRAMGYRRQLFVVDAVNAVYDACKATLNEGQLKAMEKSLDAAKLEGLKTDEMDAEAKVKFFIRKVILDPVAYDVLLEMSRKKKDS